MTSRILIIDDDVAVRDWLKIILEYDGYDCLLVPIGQDGINHIQGDNPDVIFLDAKMTGMDSLDVLRRIRELDEILPVVIMSGHGTVSTAVEATKLGAFDFLEKPLSTERGKVTIRNALDQRKLKDENRGWQRAAEAVCGSKTLREFREVNERAFLVRKLHSSGETFRRRLGRSTRPAATCTRSLSSTILPRKRMARHDTAVSGLFDIPS